MDDKALRNARKNLIGGAILLPIALLADLRFLSQGGISLLWLGITVAAVIYPLRSYQLLQAAKAQGQPAAQAVRQAQPSQPSRFGGFTEPTTSASHFEPTPSALDHDAASGPSVGTASQTETLATPATCPAVATALPSPGWYPDPNGDTRWWDGGRWTQHVAPEA